LSSQIFLLWDFAKKESSNEHFVLSDTFHTFISFTTGCAFDLSLFSLATLDGGFARKIPT
jgi:hypothetical protein